jgi:hypothetical protein
MPLEYYTVKFHNDGAGLHEKNAITSQMSAQGWYISQESIEPGHMKGGEACCLFSICMPLAFLAGRTSGFIAVTFAREVRSPSVFCNGCGSSLPQDAVFCRKCGQKLPG